MPCRGAALIPGWYKNERAFDSFLVTAYGQGAASQAPEQSQGKVGVITATFALAWEGEQVPEAERHARDGGKETGRGPEVEGVSKRVERKIGVTRDVISIRYARP